MADLRADQTRRLIALMDRLAVAAGLVAAAGWPELELTMPQLRALARLRLGACRMGAIAEHLGTGLPAATSLVERLEAKGLVVRRADAVDRRVVRCHLTDLGAAQLEQFWRMEQAEIEAVAGLLTESELDRVVDAVELLALALDRHQVRECPPPIAQRPPPHPRRRPTPIVPTRREAGDRARRAQPPRSRS